MKKTLIAVILSTCCMSECMIHANYMMSLTGDPAGFQTFIELLKSYKQIEGNIYPIKNSASIIKEQASLNKYAKSASELLKSYRALIPPKSLIHLEEKTQ